MGGYGFGYKWLQKEQEMEQGGDIQTTGAARYGQYYWCIKVPRSLCGDGEIYVHADGVQVTECGALELIYEKAHRGNLILAPGQRLAVFAASVIDGHAVAVEHWKGEVV